MHFPAAFLLCEYLKFVSAGDCPNKPSLAADFRIGRRFFLDIHIF